ncbi:MAG: dihydrofolate reductase family protein [Gemmatimonadota bacterium]
MALLRVESFAISLDGFGAGPNQTREEPLGVGGEALHDWFISTRTFQRASGGDGADTIRQYVQAPLIDELHIAIAPILLGDGESLFEGNDMLALGYEVARFAASE